MLKMDYFSCMMISSTTHTMIHASLNFYFSPKLFEIHSLMGDLYSKHHVLRKAKRLAMVRWTWPSRAQFVCTYFQLVHKIWSTLPQLSYLAWICFFHPNVWCLKFLNCMEISVEVGKFEGDNLVLVKNWALYKPHSSLP